MSSDDKGCLAVVGMCCITAGAMVLLGFPGALLVIGVFILLAAIRK
jgi:hypothetical protein